MDPESGEFGDAARAGLHVKAALDELNLMSFAKTSGSRGMHVLVPIRTGPDADEVLAFAESFVARVAAAHADELTVEHSVAARRGRVYLDPFRNGFGQTVVAPYSVRRREKAPVSTPLEWSEVKPTLIPSDFNMKSIAKRVQRADCCISCEYQVWVPGRPIQNTQRDIRPNSPIRDCVAGGTARYSVLKLPDLKQPKSTVLNGLTSRSSHDLTGGSVPVEWGDWKTPFSPSVQH
jgi:hypothetical protein